MKSGSIFVGLAAVLWGTDTLARYPLTKFFDPLFIVWLEHLAGLLLILPLVIWKHKNEIFKLKLKEVFAIIIFGIGGAAIANIFYTTSLKFSGTAVSILIVKLQPLFVLWSAFLFLGEKPTKNFFPWGIVAIIAAILLSFPELDFDFKSKGAQDHIKGVLYAFLAMAIWGFSTVAGKYFLYRHSASVTTLWRYLAATLSLGVVYFLINKGNATPWGLVFSAHTLPYLLYLASIAGVVAMGIYYKGLKLIPASKATFVELIYPLTAVILNVFILNAELSSVQVIAAALLFISLLLIIIPKSNP
ncbi:MAG: DMT family transporter [Deltaproteobacteria bacterium]|nr:DMT family transporter [Deltaproteobacteria bacterium]